ncbi:MAG: hypothetical protein ABSH05_11255 [Bryobacteraceae bacterium]|jgi:hypothetical protein
MENRQKLGYKGPVWKVTEHWQAPFESTREFEFDRGGILIGAAKPAVEVHVGEGGGRVEIRDVARYDAWSMEGLNGVAFYTRGAAVAETNFSSQGIPVQTIFKSDRNEELSRIHYLCDERGRVLEASQRDRVPPALHPRMATWPEAAREAALEALGNFMGPDVVLRVTFRYDEGDRLLEQSSYFGDRLHQRIVCTYNENGDKVTFESTDEQPYRFEYEYDQWGNWTRQVVQHPTGAAEGRRRITYYE